jgi:hypothetical protein
VHDQPLTSVPFFLMLRLVICLFTLPLALSAAEKAAPISPQLKAAVDKAVSWLAQQQRASGYFAERDQGLAKDGHVPHHTGAHTALAIMGLTSVGHMPADPTPEGRAVAKGLEFMVEHIDPDQNGYLGVSDGSRMYGHGIISLMFMEMLGMHPDPEVDRKVRERCEAGVKLILKAQKAPKGDASKGGWRYEPQSQDSDISVTVWQLMSLRAASNAGLDVPSDAIRDAVGYVKRSYRSDRDAMGRVKDMAAPISYEPGGGRQSFSTTAAGMLSLLVCGQYEAPETVGASNFLMKNPPDLGESWFYYGNYYYAQAMYQRGGDYAATARRRTEDILLRAQDSSGSWNPKNGNEKSQGAIYATSLALLSLSVYHHFLPIYQK